MTVGLAAILAGCTTVFYQPDRYMYYPPELNGYRQENIYFPSGDGTRLHGWFYRSTAGKPKGTIVQFHGNGQNMSAHYASLVWLTREGYNLFTFDYRGYGESLAEPDPEGVYKDGLAALDKAWELHRETKAPKLIVYGQSLGGAIAMRCFVDFRHQQETSLVVMDSTFISYKDVAQETLAKHWLTWAFSPLARVLVSDKFAPEKVLERFHNRTLVIHDKEDPVVKYQNGQALFAKISAKKEFWSLDHGEHIAVFFVDQLRYRRKFLDLLGAI